MSRKRTKLRPDPSHVSIPATAWNASSKSSLANTVYAVYEAGPCGFRPGRQLQAWGVVVYVIRSMELDALNEGVNTDKINATELVSRLDR